MNKSLIISTCFLAAVVLSACKNADSKKKTVRPVAVRTIMLERSESAGTRTYMGEVEAATGITLYHPLGGKLFALHVRNGQQVTKGQPIADFDDTQARSLHEASLATLEQAEDGYKRLLQVHENGGLSDVKWIEMQTNYEKARQQEIATRRSLEDCHLTAPIDGVISEADVHVGQQMFPGQTVCKVLGLRTLQVAFSVPESDVASFSIGDTVTMKLNALPEQAFLGKVLEKGLSAGAIAHTYLVKALILSPNQEMLPGMIAKVMTHKPLANGLVVPSACVQTTPEGLAVWVVRDGKAERQSIAKTMFVKDGILVGEGLHEGDQVVIAGYQKLYSGAFVTEVE